MDWSKQEMVRLLKSAPGTQYQEADDTQKIVIRDWVRSLLQAGSVSIEFVKADGTIRQMKCTLNNDLIKWETVTESALPKKERKEPTEDVVRVYDLEKEEWRSFRFDRLHKITAELSFT